MIEAKQLRVDAKRNRLYIDAAISDLPYFKNMKITDVFIDSMETFIETKMAPSDIPVYSYHLPESSKEVHLVLDKVDTMLNKPDDEETDGSLPEHIDFTNNIMFIYFRVEGIPAPDCPCNEDREYHLFTVFSTDPIYCRMMQYTKETIEDCTIPKKFIDMILWLDYVKVALETGNYVTAIKYYNKLMGNMDMLTAQTKTCNCHG